MQLDEAVMHAAVAAAHNDAAGQAQIAIEPRMPAQAA